MAKMELDFKTQATAPSCMANPPKTMPMCTNLCSISWRAKAPLFFHAILQSTDVQGSEVIRKWVSSYEAKVLVSEKDGLFIDEASR
jgi:hypothetical protein